MLPANNDSFKNLSFIVARKINNTKEESTYRGVDDSDPEKVGRRIDKKENKM